MPLLKPKTLYLGLDPKHYALQFDEDIEHAPIIKIEPLINKQLKRFDKKKNTPVVFSSKTAVFLMMKWDPSYVIANQTQLISIGPVTTCALKSFNLRVSFEASEFTQEGLSDVIEKEKFTSIAYPRSLKSRHYLDDYCTKKKIELESRYLYTTCVNHRHQPKQLSNFDKIVITSPSCIKAFFEIYRKDLVQQYLDKIFCIGPITETEYIQLLAIHGFNAPQKIIMQ